MTTWGGPGRGGGARPKDPAAALGKALATLKHRLGVARRLHIGTAEERRAVLQEIEAIRKLAKQYLADSE